MCRGGGGGGGGGGEWGSKIRISISFSKLCLAEVDYSKKGPGVLNTIFRNQTVHELSL